MRGFLLVVVVVLSLPGCGTAEQPNGTLSLDCGTGIPCGDIYSEDLLLKKDTAAITIDFLREYVLNKKVSRSLADTPFKQRGDGRGDIDDLMWGLEVVKQLYGINPIFALALSIHESGWGTSRYGRDKRNLWGWNSGYCTSANRCGDSFDKATGFGSYSNGFNTVFRKIKQSYLTERDKAAGTGRFHHACSDRKEVRCVGNDIKQHKACGASLAGMNCSYAEDDDWAKLIRAHMNDITVYVNNNFEPQPDNSSCAVGVM